VLTKFPLFLIFPLYREYKRRRKNLDEILLAFKDPRRCSVSDGEYSVVISMGNEEKTIIDCLKGVMNLSPRPMEVHLFVEARDRTLENILKLLRDHGYRMISSHVIEEYLNEDNWGWNRRLKAKAIITVHERKDMPRVYVYESIGDVLGKGLSINWLVKKGYIKTRYFLQLDADTVPEPELAKKLLCSIKQDERIAGVYAFAYEIAEDKSLMARIKADYGYNMYKRMSHVIFRESWNYLEFCITMEGLHIMFRTDVYRRVPRPLDTLAGDMAHAWELQANGYIILGNIYAKSYVREISTIKGLIKQRLKWNAGPIQNFYIRGASTLKRVRNKARASFAIFYAVFVSPTYHSFWLLGPLVLLILGSRSLYQALLYYIVDLTIHLASAIYSTLYLRRIHSEFKEEKSLDFVKKFLSYYFVFRIPVALVYAYVYPKTLFEILVHHMVKRRKEKRKWFLLT